jgi:predicted Rossmann fold nucleotide-binding protein DprA/Smf involved in DNA uptake
MKIKMILTVDPTMVGSLIAELSGRVDAIGFEIEELKDGRGKRRKDVGLTILAALSKGPLISRELIGTLKLPPHIVYNALSALRKAGKVKKAKSTGNWSIVK